MTKQLFLLASASLLFGACDKGTPSALDNIKVSPEDLAKKVAEKEPGQTPPEPEKAPVKHTGTLEERVAALEARLDKSAEALNALDQAYAAQKAQMKEQQEEQEKNTPAPDGIFAVDISDNIKAGQVEGPMDAPVTIVDAFDFACPYCRKVSTTLEELVKEYDGKVRVVYKDMIVHPQVATEAHMASCAAAKQGKYLPFKHALWEKGFDPYFQGRDPSKLGKDNLLVIANDVGLDVEKLKTDMASKECQDHMNVDKAELVGKFNVNSTPTLYINGTVVPGALPKETFKELIDQKLKLVADSGVKPGEYYDKEIMAKGEKKFRNKLTPKPN